MHVPLRRVLLSGLNSAASTVSSYFDSAGNSRQINFTTFLTMFSDRLLSLDPEDEMLEAFASFDEKDSGYVSVAKMRELLASSGDRMSDEEVCYRCASLWTLSRYMLKNVCVTRSSGSFLRHLQTSTGCSTIENS